MLLLLLLLPAFCCYCWRHVVYNKWCNTHGCHFIIFSKKKKHLYIYEKTNGPKIVGPHYEDSLLARLFVRLLCQKICLKLLACPGATRRDASGSGSSGLHRQWRKKLIWQRECKQQADERPNGHCAFGRDGRGAASCWQNGRTRGGESLLPWQAQHLFVSLFTNIHKFMYVCIYVY